MKCRRRKNFLLAAGLALLLVLAIQAVVWGEREVPVFGPDSLRQAVLIIDAGHGGEDGGAVSVTGTRESDLNLAVAKRVDALAGFYGVQAVLLRDSDRSLHNEEAQTLHEKKESDLKNRVQTVEETEGAMLLSIHQNSYPDSRYRGAQVFYSNEALSSQWAELTQNLLRAALDQENHRLAKVIPDTIYLMNHITCPALLVECGFLSNPEEALLLESDGYQTKIALSLLAAFLQARAEGVGP